MGDSLLEVKDVSASRGAFRLAGISLSLGEGEVLAVLGPSGCGKSTLLDLICGLQSPTQGQILLSGKSAVGLPTHRRNMSVALQDLGLWDRLSARKNVALACVQGSPDEWLDRVMFNADRNVATARLSGGERQRVALARTLSRRAALTLLDEPGANLDRLSNLRLAETAVATVREWGGALIVVAHRLDEVLRYEPGSILVLESGRVARHGPVEEVIRDPQTFYVASLLGYEIMIPARTGDDRSDKPATAEGSTVAPAFHAWRFGGIRESSQGTIAAKVLSLLASEVGQAARVETSDGDCFLIPATANTSAGASILLVADAPVAVRA
ncbi:MAG: ABC transporter ATP-binding protein [Planctomycetes bacterium]|nr:ABC transporter ATP-binding protein [Planctomycetota bacterium]